MKSHAQNILRTAVPMTALLISFAANGQSAPSKAAHPCGPPPEAIEACKTQKSEAQCSFVSPRATVKGTCWAPEGKPLACRPKDAPPPPADDVPRN